MNKADMHSIDLEIKLNIKPLTNNFVGGFFIPILLKGGEKNKRELNF